MLKIAARLERSKKMENFITTNSSVTDVEEPKKNLSRQNLLKFDTRNNAKCEPKMTTTAMEIANGNGIFQSLKIKNKACYGTW